MPSLWWDWNRVETRQSRLPVPGDGMLTLYRNGAPRYQTPDLDTILNMVQDSEPDSVSTFIMIDSLPKTSNSCYKHNNAKERLPMFGGLALVTARVPKQI